MGYLNEEVNCTKLSTSAKIPWTDTPAYFCLLIGDKGKSVITLNSGVNFIILFRLNLCP